VVDLDRGSGDLNQELVGMDERRGKEGSSDIYIRYGRMLREVRVRKTFHDECDIGVLCMTLLRLTFTYRCGRILNDADTLILLNVEIMFRYLSMPVVLSGCLRDNQVNLISCDPISAYRGYPPALFTSVQICAAYPSKRHESLPQLYSYVVVMLRFWLVAHQHECTYETISLGGAIIRAASADELCESLAVSKTCIFSETLSLLAGFDMVLKPPRMLFSLRTP
jgi:hypothetical protein